MVQEAQTSTNDQQYDKTLLRTRQSWPLNKKVEFTKEKIKQWYNHYNGCVYVAYSGGKDSDVLLHIVRSIYPDVVAVFSDTGLEWPEIISHVKATQNVTTVRPRKSFKKVLDVYGYPVVSKRVARYVEDLQHPTEANHNTRNLRLTGFNRAGTFCPTMKLSNKWRFLIDAPFKVSARCCDVMKKSPLNAFHNKTGLFPLTGEMAADSSDREKTYLRGGCANFYAKHPKATPLAIWTQQDILQYCVENAVKICSVYGDIVNTETGLALTGEQHTGCTFCMFGLQYDKGENRFQRMKRTHPKRWEYCMNQLGLARVLKYLGVPSE